MNKGLFWDVNLSELKQDEHSKFIIERVLCYGDQNDFSWLVQTYGSEKIKDIFSSSRNLDSRTVSCFNNVFGLQKELSDWRKL